MSEEKISPVGELLFEHYLLFQQKHKRAITQKEFAEIIGIDDKMYNHIYKGRRIPSRAMVAQLAEFFGDLRFFDAVGEDRPDESLFTVNRNWERIPSNERKKIGEIAGKYSAD